MEAGVYLISNNVNGKCYVGSTIHLDQRRKEHFSRLANNKHINAHLQNAYNKYGREAFDFEILETVDIDDNIKDKLLKREQFWIDNLKPEYNVLLVAGSNLGYHHTEETKKKISESTTGVKKSDEHAKHIREGQSGRVLTEEHKAKLSEAAKHRKSPSNHAIISIDGVIYNSLKEASEATGVKYNTIQKRLKNPNFSNYYYVKFGNQPPKDLVKV
nr:MAG: GIY-YIG catalytic domain protein [Bacteriophage sp.]